VTIKYPILRVEGDLELLGDPYLLTMSCEVTIEPTHGQEQTWWFRLQQQDLSGCFHHSVFMMNASLYGARIFQEFREASFNGTTFQNANMSGCTFVDCDFHDCAFDFTDCGNTVFIRCNIIDTSFGDADFSSAGFTDCKVRGSFEGTNFGGAHFNNCELGGGFADTLIEGLTFTASVAQVLRGDKAIIRRLFEMGLCVTRSDDEQFEWDPEALEPEPSDETEAWFRRWERSD
jgi:uncharacterized protein YjbI with pentapeptide repeats